MRDINDGLSERPDRLKRVIKLQPGEKESDEVDCFAAHRRLGESVCHPRGEGEDKL